MRTLRNTLWPAGLAFGIVAELIGRPPLTALDATTGFALTALGLLAWSARPSLAAGAIMAVAGFAWFLGAIAGWAVLLHRAPVAQLMITYPARRLWPGPRLERLGVLGAYGYALAYPIAANDQATIVFALALLALAGHRYLASGGPERRARASALAAASAFALVLIAGALLRLSGAATRPGVLGVYELVVVLIAAGLFADLKWGEWTRATVTALVVDLGQPASAGTLRDRLARTLADPTLNIAYWLDEQTGYVDEAGRPVALPSEDQRQAVQLIDDKGSPLAALIHDPAALDDPALLAGITAATRLAIANVRLRAQVRARVEQVKASRRRLLETADEQRRHLELELRRGAEQHLTHVTELLAHNDPQLAQVNAGLAAARAELRELARGIHPATLTDRGLNAALTELAARSPVPVKLTAPSQRWSAPLEAAAYFICSEALANIAKHAHAANVTIQITNTETELRLEIADDGVGDTNPEAGSGLRGLADRAAALGGHITITSPIGHGTLLAARLPLRPTP